MKNKKMLISWGLSHTTLVNWRIWQGHEKWNLLAWRGCPLSREVNRVCPVRLVPSSIIWLEYLLHTIIERVSYWLLLGGPQVQRNGEKNNPRLKSIESVHQYGLSLRINCQGSPLEPRLTRNLQCIGILRVRLFWIDRWNYPGWGFFWWNCNPMSTNGVLDWHL